jgi:mannosyltransferase
VTDVTRDGGRFARRDAFVLTAITALAAAVRFIALGRQSFWVDETVTADLLSKPFTRMLGALPHSESTPPLYYVLAWIWSRIFGSGEAALRSLSALFGTLTVPVAFAVATRLVSRRAGWAVAAIAAVSPLLVWYSQEARAYSLFAFLSALSLLFFARALEEPSPSALSWWAATSALALLTHYFALFFVAAEAAALLYHRRRQATYVATGAITAVATAVLPLAAYQAKYGSSSWIRSLDLRFRIEETLGQLLVPSHPRIWAGAGVPENANTWWPLAILLLAGGGCAAIVLLSGARQKRGVLMSFYLGGVAVAAPIVVSLAASLLVSGRGDVFLYRNVICAWLPLTIVVAAGLTAPRAGAIGIAATAGLCAASLALLIVNSTTSHLQRDDWRLLARAIHGPRRAVILSPSWEVAALKYYDPLLVTPRRNLRVREIDILVRRWSPSYSVPVQGFNPPRQFRRVEVRTLQNWVLTVFRAPKVVDVSPRQLENVRPRNASRVALERR